MFVKLIQNLIVTLEQCIPGLDVNPLSSALPASTEQHTVLAWLYTHLSEQRLMTYKEWNEYSGEIPDLAPLAALSLTENAADFIYGQLENIDWSAASIDPAELPYILPWLEHLNFYLQPSGLRLVDLLPFENAYIFCVRDDEALLEKLNADLQAFGIGINDRSAMDPQQVADEIASLL
ncbi:MULTISPECIES: hypothetical protein [unclassified Enterobacter]|uniref:hypothetical protein n=1 Tax=unclassified Enterobacter TaxID=2608935 RepID=UPI000F49A88E|nr:MULTISPECIES: hypothetical protein [unclassified Enterobacter]